MVQNSQDLMWCERYLGEVHPHDIMRPQGVQDRSAADPPGSHRREQEEYKPRSVHRLRPPPLPGHPLHPQCPASMTPTRENFQTLGVVRAVGGLQRRLLGGPIGGSTAHRFRQVTSPPPHQTGV